MELSGGCFEWLTDSSVVVPEILDHLLDSLSNTDANRINNTLCRSREDSSHWSLKEIRRLLLIDLGCGTSSLSFDVASDLVMMRRGLRDDLRDEENGLEIRILRIDLPDAQHDSKHDDDIQSGSKNITTTFHGCDLTIRAPEEHIIPSALLEYRKAKQITVTLDKSTLDFLLSSKGSAEYLQNLSCSIKADLAYFLSFHPPIFMKPVLEAIYGDVMSKNLPRCSADATGTASIAAADTAATAWDADGSFRPSSVYQKSVWLYSCSSPLPPDPSRVGEALQRTLDVYFKEVEPMLTTGAERRLRDLWGLGRGLEGESWTNNATCSKRALTLPNYYRRPTEAYRLMFPDESLRECYSLEDFKGEWEAWGGESGGAIDIEDGIRFLRENQ